MTPLASSLKATRRGETEDDPIAGLERAQAPSIPIARAGSLCAGHVRQLGGASPPPNLMEVKG